MKRDMLLNILASFFITAVIQLICYPLLAYKTGSDCYGTLLLVMGVTNMVAGLLGGSLNNSRLLSQKDYLSLGNRADGDFNIIITVFECIAALVSFCFSLFVTGDAINSALVAAASFFITFVGYHNVAFRLVIDYKKNFLLSLVRAIGYMVGIALFFVLGVWALPFFVGELAGCIYLSISADTVKEPFAVTPRFSPALKKCLLLVWGNMASSITQYADRLLLYPYLGAASVSNFTVASYLGKTSGLVANPISSVLLTYYSKETAGISKGIFWKRFGVMALALALFYVAIVIIAEPFLNIFYPTLASEALPYVPLASGAAIISILCAFVLPMMLSYAKTYWQPVVQYGYLVVYVALALIGAMQAGLSGFCVGIMVAGVVRLALMLLVTVRSL